MKQLTPTRVLRSLRSRILLLALLVCVLLASALTGFFLLLRQTQSTIIGSSVSHLYTVFNTFAKDYLSAAGSSNGSEVIQALMEEPTPRADSILATFSVNAFRRDPGVEGGFYSASTESLLGYAFPTQDGPGPKQDIPRANALRSSLSRSRRSRPANRPHLSSADRRMSSCFKLCLCQETVRFWEACGRCAAFTMWILEEISKHSWE